MSKQSLIKKIPLILFSGVIVLLILNIAVTKYVEKDDQPIDREAILGSEIDSIFRTALANYGFSDNWIIKKKIKNITGDSLFTTYSVSVPEDVPIHLIILELKNLFWDYEVDIEAEELVRVKKTLLKLISGKQLKLAVELFYNDKVKREYGTASFIVSDLPLEDEQVLNSFLEIPELYYVIMTPKDASKRILPVLSKAGKRYALLLNDNITELNFKLSGNYSDDKIKKTIREIVGTFYNAVFIIIDDRSDLFESRKYPLIESELLKRGIVLVTSSKFETLSASNVNTTDKFQDFMKTIQKHDEKVLLITSLEFSSIVNLIPSYRKIGYKFIYPGDVIIKRDE